MNKKELLKALCSTFTVSGYEEMGHEKIKELLSPYFDDCFPVGVGGLAFVSRCHKEHPKKVLIDAHMDENGLIVTDIQKDGLLNVAPVGGMDPRTVSAERFVIHGDKKDVPAVAVKRPFKMVPKTDNRMVPVRSQLLFTGYQIEELDALGVRVGSPINYDFNFVSRTENEVACKCLDDKCSAVAAVETVEYLKGKDLDCDVYLLFSGQEETYGAGVKTGVFGINPDEIFVVDVSFGFTPECDKSKCIDLGKGPSVTLSVQTDKQMTKDLTRIAKEKEIPLQTETWVRGTGTNAGNLVLQMGGIPMTTVGIPLKYMHTNHEIINVEDVKNAGALMGAYIEEKYGHKEEKQ